MDDIDKKLDSIHDNIKKLLDENSRNKEKIGKALRRIDLFLNYQYKYDNGVTDEVKKIKKILEED